MRPRIGIRLIAVAASALLLAGCAGLPTSGPPNAGLAIGEDGELVDFTPIARSPQPGAGPQQIVAGFLEASMTPADNWEIAQEFLTDSFARTWDPQVGVAIDSSAESRDFTASVDDEDETATSAEVDIRLNQVASVSAEGIYSADTGAAKATYRLERPEGGEWRIAEAKDGITLDRESFSQVYEEFSLKYFDPGFTHLVSDVRWFPRRAAMATAVARTLVSGDPAPWLAPAVRSAFPADVTIVGDAVPVSEQVASVSLSRAALSASSTTLARMRTQLEASLSGAGVSEVRLLVDGAALDVGTAEPDETIVDPGVLVLTDGVFGTAAAGEEIAPVAGLSAQIAEIVDPIRSVDVSADGRLGIVQLQDGQVFAAREGGRNRLDTRAGLIAPSLDPFGFTWTVPAGDPRALEAWDATSVSAYSVAGAWPDASSISQLRVAADGTRIAAIVTSGEQRRLVVAAINRGDDLVPTELGEVKELARLSGPAQGLAWVGSDTLAVLGAGSDPTLGLHPVGGPAAVFPAPTESVTVAGARTPTGLRVLSSDEAVWAQRGSSWQETVSGVQVLGTRAGY